MKKLLKKLYHPVKNSYLFIAGEIENYRQFLFFKKLIGKNKLVFDIGAHTGSKTELFNKLGNRVIAIEPQNLCFEVLQKKFKDNPDIKLVKLGVGNMVGEGTMHISSMYNGFSTLKEGWQKGTKYDRFDKTEVIKITTFDNLIKEYGLPHFCKIDVEGYELEVFNGLNSKIDCLNFEYHGSDIMAVKNCLNRLDILKFSKYNYTIGEGKFELKNWVDMDALIDDISKKIVTLPDIWGDIYAS